MPDKYILIGQTPVPCDDLLEWARWMEGADSRVFETTVGEYWVSTVFLGLDHNWLRDGEPLLFETMIFFIPSRQLERRPGEGLLEYGKRKCKMDETAADQELVNYQKRYYTWLEAEAGHEAAVRLAERSAGVSRTAAGHQPVATVPRDPQ